MGSCVSSHHRKAPAPASTIDYVPSPVKDSAVNGADVLVSRLSASQSKPAVRDYGMNPGNPYIVTLNYRGRTVGYDGLIALFTVDIFCVMS